MDLVPGPGPQAAAPTSPERLGDHGNRGALVHGQLPRLARLFMPTPGRKPGRTLTQTPVAALDTFVHQEPP